MVAAEIMQKYKKLQFERGRCPSVLARDRIWVTSGSALGDCDYISFGYSRSENMDVN